MTKYQGLSTKSTLRLFWSKIFSNVKYILLKTFSFYNVWLVVIHVKMARNSFSSVCLVVKWKEKKKKKILILQPIKSKQPPPNHKKPTHHQSTDNPNHHHIGTKPTHWPLKFTY